MVSEWLAVSEWVMLSEWLMVSEWFRHLLIQSVELAILALT